MSACGQGHESDEPDYCSVCGAKMPSAGAPSAAAAVPGGGCPMCGELRDADARYCEVCRYDFVDGKPGPPPTTGGAVASALVPQASSLPSGQPSSSAPARARPGRAAWELVILADPALDTEPDPETPFPKDEPERVMLIDTHDMLVGRRDEQRDIKPEIPLNDPGASRRHAKFVVNADGTIALQDLASTNGTQVNGEVVTPGARRSLRAGDEVTLGRWTRIKLRERP